MSWLLSIRNRQQVRAIDSAHLRRLARSLVRNHLPIKDCTLGLHLVNAEEMAALNQRFLGHKGSTDVITFDHREQPNGKSSRAKTWTANTPRHDVHGEIYISVPDAIHQARLFRTTWQAEVVRYVIHGLLHLLGHDDHTVMDRRRMKQVENELVKVIAADFSLAALARLRPRLRPRPPPPARPRGTGRRSKSG
jgi:rRNA maturation RNase YbeY